MSIISGPREFGLSKLYAGVLMLVPRGAVEMVFKLSSHHPTAQTTSAEAQKDTPG
jgi:hypothetical protein